MRLRGVVAVVTGASRGIGRAIAAALMREGAIVAGCARHVDASRTDDRAATDHGRSFVSVCDVRSAADVGRFTSEVLDRVGPPQILVNNAGVVARAPLESLGEEAWDNVVDANLKGTFLVTRAFLPAMKGGRAPEAAEVCRGRIINIASIAGRQGTPGLTAYCAAKHGVVGLTRALAEELRPDRIAVNAVCPGSVDTEMLNEGMPGAVAAMGADDVARVALFLAMDAPAVLTGSCVDVFG